MAKIDELDKNIGSTDTTFNRTSIRNDDLKKKIEASRDMLDKFWEREIKAAKLDNMTLEEAKAVLVDELDFQDNEQRIADQANPPKTPNSYDKKEKFLKSLAQETKKADDTRKSLLHQAYLITKEQAAKHQANNELIAELEAEISEMEKKIEYYDSEIYKNEERINEINTKDLPEAKDRRNKIVEDLKNQEIDSQKKSLEKLKSERDSIVAKKTKLEKKIEKINDKINEKKDRLKNLQKKSKKSDEEKAEISDLKDEIEKLNGDKTTMEAEKGDLEKDISGKDTEISESEDNIKGLEDGSIPFVAPSSAELDSIDANISELDKELTTCGKNITGYEDLIKKVGYNPMFRTKLYDLMELNKQLEENLIHYNEYFNEEFEKEGFSNYQPTQTNTRDTRTNDYTPRDGKGDGQNGPKGDPSKPSAGSDKTDGEEKPTTPKGDRQQPQQATRSNAGAVAPFANGDVVMNTETNAIAKLDPILSARATLEGYIAMSPDERRQALNTSGYYNLMDAINCDNIKLSGAQRNKLQKALREDQQSMLDSVDLENSKEEILETFSSFGIGLSDKDFEELYGGSNPNILYNLRKIEKGNIKILQNTMQNFYNGTRDPEDVEKFNKYIGNFLKHGQLQNSLDNLGFWNKVRNSITKSNGKINEIDKLNKVITNGEIGIDNNISIRKNSLNDINQYVYSLKDEVKNRTQIKSKEKSKEEVSR